MFGVLRSLLGPEGAALLAHLLQELSGERAADLHQRLHLAPPAAPAQVPQLPERDGAAHQRPGRAASQRLPAGHRGEVPERRRSPLPGLPRAPAPAAQRLLRPGTVTPADGEHGPCFISPLAFNHCIKGRHC